MSNQQSTLIASGRWYDALALCQQSGRAHVLATITAVNGSAPRALQTKMVITEDGHYDTLGGGGLEHDVIITARQLLKNQIESPQRSQSHTAWDNTNAGPKATDKKPVCRDRVYSKHYPLGAKLAQCCGGSVTVMFECFNTTAPMSLLVFGAGHVAAALMTLLAELPCQVDWVDSRPQMFARYHTTPPQESKPTALNDTAQNLLAPAVLPAHIRPHIDDDPTGFIHSHASGRYVLIMTHDHSLDFELVRCALAANIATNDDVRIPYIGCIGSATKAKRFKDRLQQRGYDPKAVADITMPIGLDIGGKEPMSVAISIAAQILQHYHQQQNH